MKLEYGTEEEHIATLERAKSNKITYVWSGAMRNNYLRENLEFGKAQGIIKVDFVEQYEAQESGYNLTWLK